MSRRLLYVPVDQEALDELRRRADEERRRPQDEAALLLEWALSIGLPVAVLHRCEILPASPPDQGS